MTKHYFISPILLLIISLSSIAQTTLTDAEAQLYQEILGITLTESEKSQIAEIVKPSENPQWRIDAENRIAQYRKANLEITIVDDSGTPIPDATVNVRLTNPNFHYGVVVRAEDLVDGKNYLSDAGSTSEDWKKLVLGLSNAIGAGNNFKPKLTGLHEYLPAFVDWTAQNNLYLRGHLLIWPGSKGIPEMDAEGSVINETYGRHLSNGGNSSLAGMSGYENIVSYDVEQAVLTYKASARTQADKDALKAVVDAEIAQWAGLWNVGEWDVINETLSSYLLMEILGYDQMAKWFNIAENNMVNPDCKLVINDYTIVSAPEDLPTTPNWMQYEDRKTDYFANIQRIIDDGGRVDKIGFQNRYKWGIPNGETTYNRLVDFGNEFGLEMVGTEFEVVDDPEDTRLPYDYNETERAKITEETLLAYLSHPLTTGLFNWTFMEATDDKSLTYYDGTVKLNGLVWFYLFQIKYRTNEELLTSSAGLANFNAFKGAYEVTVSYDGNDYVEELQLGDDLSHQIALNDVHIEVDPPVITSVGLIPIPLTDNQLNIQLDNTYNQVRIQLVAIDGSVVFNQDYFSVSEIAITPTLSTGIYVLRIQADNVILEGKVVVE